MFIAWYIQNSNALNPVFIFRYASKKRAFDLYEKLSIKVPVFGTMPFVHARSTLWLPYADYIRINAIAGGQRCTKTRPFVFIWGNL